jgi:hypothetical protein
MQQGLLETGIIAEAGFRLEVRVGEEIELRVVVVELIERGRIVPGADRCLEFGAGFRDQIGGCEPIGRLAAELAVVVVAQADRIEEAVAPARLELDIAGVVGVMRGGRRAVGEPVIFVLAAERQDLARASA